MNTAAMVRKRKEAHPELYCTDRRCLWRTGGGPCPRHKPAEDAPKTTHAKEARLQAIKAYPPSQLPETPAGRLEMVMAWLHNTDEDGNPDPLITPEVAAKLLGGPMSQLELVEQDRDAAISLLKLHVIGHRYVKDCDSNGGLACYSCRTVEWLEAHGNATPCCRRSPHPGVIACDPGDTT